MKRVILILSVLAAVAMGIIDFTYDDSIKPDTVHPMANQHISWQYAGK